MNRYNQAPHLTSLRDVRAKKVQTSLRIRAVCSAPLLFAIWSEPALLHAQLQYSS